MSRARSLSSRALVGLTAAAAALLPAATAGAAPAAHRPHHGLPVVEHARALGAEPVVEPGRGRPPNKLLVKNLVTGTGATARPSSVVKVKYVGAAFRTGKDFTQATWTQGQPASFSLAGGVIKGFAKGLVGMRVGGRRELVIPPKLGYGNHAVGPISRQETLVFVVDLVAVSG